MQNSLAVPPKDEGESNIPSGTIQSRKGLQNKSQFRTIAPKIVPKVLTSRMLPCHSPSRSDQVNLGPSINSKPLGMSTQNYALMQVAGQEGTFSLVALPHVASAQPIQKPRMSLPENLKLPIPRYQPPRNSKGSRKKPILIFPKSGCSKAPAQTQMCPQVSPSPPHHPELLYKPSPFEEVPSLEQAPASIGTAALTNGSDHGDLRPPVTNTHGNLNPPATPASSTPDGPAKQDLTGLSGKPHFVSKVTSSKPSAVASEKFKERVDLAKTITSLSPTILGNAVPLISSVPKGKLPIPPYSRMKTMEVYKIKSDASIAGFSSPGPKADCDKISSTTEGFNAATKVASKLPVPQVSQQSPCESAFCPPTKLDLNHKTKLNSGTAKRKGRKRKVPDEILAFQGKRRKCVINKCRDGKERVKNDPQEFRDQKLGTLKKYRSIMPKPIMVIPTLTPLASPATLQSQMLGGLGQDVSLNNSLTPKYLGCKQDNSSSPKPSSMFRSGFSGIKKPWHRCHVCNHHFQFKQHLRDHMNTHTNRRPYSCRICRKSYVRPGSLSTHMKLHHGENRLKKLMCCEFCAKVFGHVRVYFGHLKEVHRVVISTEPAASELQPGDIPKNRDMSVRGTEGSLERENKFNLEEDFLLNQADEVKLQIKCGRCQITAQSFAEIKFHLLYVHGEEIQGRLQEGTFPGSKGTQEELVQHASPDWKRHPERGKPEKLHSSEEDSHACPRLKRQLHLHHQNGMEMLMENEGPQSGTNKPRETCQGPECPGLHTVVLWSHSGFNCLLCAEMLGRKEDLLRHWKHQHNCEDPSKLWVVLNTVSNQGVIELSSEAEK
ncbi:zinc finger protein 438 isoform X2 [Papio anubis]|nr:zinc finger protein 438 isoform X2 [Papio anubis]XP_009212457.1 zinc finger protein 438 isoform X2 [Papio anubis]XP_009212459.1 zinc finger protein 438 isoform X2 [Papio anubis]XP_009212460.1 zinc finger protein 438 isoform X2 [Papio anubis]XP_009212461.1 zinc finger protein 438 isoform X2 [Papio anubis]XP_017818133.1 zinc finger protein 438 isoform X2 [Papio anubis]XP_017818135.1 zinc finger protein 438 isoform X2 [Papio anubis]XP_021799646.1 zinc finger protein 438 isoform X2 [Papio anu